MKRMPCRCGRMMNPGSGHDWCSHCIRTGKIYNQEPATYTLEQEIEVLQRARRAEKQGVIPVWQPQDTPGGIRYLVAGALLPLEDFDLYVAARIRERKRVA